MKGFRIPPTRNPRSNHRGAISSAFIKNGVKKALCGQAKKKTHCLRQPEEEGSHEGQAEFADFAGGKGL